MDKEREIKIYRATLELIKDIAYDYDGWRDANNLMDLIDELRETAIRGLNIESPTSLNSNGVVVDIFGEPIKIDGMASK